MLLQFRDVWDVLFVITQSIPFDVTMSVSFVFAAVGVVGILRSL